MELDCVVALCPEDAVACQHEAGYLMRTKLGTRMQLGALDAFPLVGLGSPGSAFQGMEIGSWSNPAGLHSLQPGSGGSSM